MIHPPIISTYVDDNNNKIVTNSESVIFNTQVKSLRHDGHIYTFRNVMLA